MELTKNIAFALIAGSFGMTSLISTAYAQARSLYSAPLPLYTDHTISCLIVNTSSRERKVGTAIMLSVNELTGQVDMIDYDEIVLMPGSARDVSAGCLENCGLVYCKFTVEGSKRAFRASACLQQPNSGALTCVTAEKKKVIRYIPQLNAIGSHSGKRERAGPGQRVQPAVRSRYAASGWLKSGSLAADPG